MLPDSTSGKIVAAWRKRNFHLVVFDPNDNHLLASLITSKADGLITGDSDFDELYGLYPIIAPGEFLRRFF